MIRSRLKYLIGSLVLALGTVSSYGGFGFFGDGGSYIILDFGAGNEYFELGPSSSPNPSFAGSRLNDYNQGEPNPKPFRHSFDTLVLNGFENNTFENGSDNVLTGNLSYRVYEVGTTPGAFKTLSFTEFTDFDDSVTDNLLNPGDERHGRTDAGINILAGIADSGTYVLEAFAWAQADYGDGGPLDDTIWAGPGGTIYQSASGSAPIGVFTATFSVERLPEPSTIGLLGFGAVLIRTIRKKSQLSGEDDS